MSTPLAYVRVRLGEHSSKSMAAPSQNWTLIGWPASTRQCRECPERITGSGRALPAAWIEVLDVFARLTRFTDDPVSVFLADQILDFRRVMQG
jgi:hypothetical protein